MKALGLSLVAALSLMALSAAGAQASGEFWVEMDNEHVPFEDIPLEEELIEGEAHGSAEFAVPGLALGIYCPGAEIHGSIFANGTTSTTIVASECELLGAPCEIYPTATDLAEETNEGVVVLKGAGLVVLQGGAHYLLVKGVGEEEAFSTSFFHGDECPLGTISVQCTGSTAFQLPTALDLEQDQILRPLLHEQALAVGATGIIFGTELAEVHSGDVLAYLAGAFSNEPWGAE